MRARDPRSRPGVPHEGFTLIELLVVISILGLLMAVVVPTYAKFQQHGRVKQVRALISGLSSAAENFRAETGDYPPSSFSDLDVFLPKAKTKEKRTVASNDLNEGIEAFVVALFSDAYHGSRDEKHLGNVDDDASAKSLTVFPEPDLFEYLDDWGNPYIYFHNRDYDKTRRYLLLDTETETTSEVAVEAVKNPATGRYYNSESFQLFSAGPDGIPGNDDDIHAWDK